MIDRYKLLEEIGRGGMGTVYMAQQTEPVKRRVALKVINPGMDSREVVARFEAERQALAMMDHANIARVFDGGTTAEGRPYFVMELVRGVPVTSYCENNSLDLAARLHLFIQVCQAVQHAHQKGIIHRDLKPSNVQVTNHDGEPIVKVIDFGVAKALHHDLSDRTLFTQFNQLIGTPLYMSPEQADRHGSDVDTRSDIYSLGMLLYELLTGTTPFDREELSQAGVDEARRIICEVEPPRPSVRVSTLAAADDSTLHARREVDRRKLFTELRGDLDCIVMKALEKKREDRYESASAFAKDLQRHLDREPIEAKPSTALTKLSKWLRRHQELAWASGATFVLALTLLAIWVGIQIATERAIAAQIAQGATQASQALADDDSETAKTVLAGTHATVVQMADARHPLLERINALQRELQRYEEFSRLYEKARRNRGYGTGIPENAYKALAIYGLPEHNKWLDELQDSEVPEEFVTRVGEKVYEMLVLAAHHRLLWMGKDDERGKLTRIADAQTFLELAKTIRQPTKGFYWTLACCSQRMGDLTDGVVQERHDREALRLRALAADTEPQCAAELFYISRDRGWGCASENAREAFKNPISDDEMLVARQEVVNLDPTYYNGLFFLALNLSNVERWAESLQAWNGCLALMPEDTTARFDRGECLIRLGAVADGIEDQQQAIELARTHLKKHPSRTYSTYYLACLLELHSEQLLIAGKPRKAVAAFEEARRLSRKAVQEEPTHPDYNQLLERLRDGLDEQKENGGPPAKE